jgi:hypothetical protein
VRVIAWEWYDREDIDRLCAKITMSSLYGKFGVRHAPDGDPPKPDVDALMTARTTSEAVTAAGVSMDIFRSLFYVERNVGAPRVRGA